MAKTVVDEFPFLKDEEGLGYVCLILCLIDLTVFIAFLPGGLVFMWLHSYGFCVKGVKINS